MVLISLCIITAASAADNVSDVVEITDDAPEVQAIDNVTTLLTNQFYPLITVPQIPL